MQNICVTLNSEGEYIAGEHVPMQALHSSSATEQEIVAMTVEYQDMVINLCVCNKCGLVYTDSVERAYGNMQAGGSA